MPKKTLCHIFYIILTAIAIWLFVKYLLKPLLPFILAWLISMILASPIDLLTKKSGIARKAVCFFVVSLALLVISCGLYLFSSIFLSELRSIITGLESEISGVISEISGLFDGGLLSRFPQLSTYAGIIDSASREILEHALSLISPRIVSVISSIPGAILSFLIFAIALYYICMDLRSVNNFFGGMLPDNLRSRLRTAKDRMILDGGRYFRAYAIILSITFAQLLFGFLILKIPYSFTLAFLIAIIDILPILGVGTVLIPWALILLLRGNAYLGIGLLILWAIIFVVRRITEPKLVSVSTGISPLLSLFSIYVGAELMGALGIIVFPMLAIFIKNLYECGVFRS